MKNPWNQANLFGDPPADQPRKVTIKIPAGSKLGACSSSACGAHIYWVETAEGRLMPVDEDGTPHHATCPDAARFKKKKVTP